MKTKFKNPKSVNTRELIGCKSVTEVGIETYSQDRLTFFIVHPTNLSVLSEESIRGKIQALTTVLKALPELELICTNSRESFEENKRFIRKRLAEEEVPEIRRLLELDLLHLDEIQTQMATSREFLVIYRSRHQSESELHNQINRVEKTFREAGLNAHRASEKELKKILAVYFEQNVTTDQFEGFDGERWITSQSEI